MPPKPAIGNPMAALASLTGQQMPTGGAQSIGQFVTAAMLAASANPCPCETCRLMRKAAENMRHSLLEEDKDGRG